MDSHDFDDVRTDFRQRDCVRRWKIMRACKMYQVLRDPNDPSVEHNEPESRLNLDEVMGRIPGNNAISPDVYEMFYYPE